LEISTNDAAEKENYELLEPPQLLDKCRSDAMKRLAFANNDSEKTMILEKFNDCLSKGLVPKLKLANDEVAFEKTIREEISDQSENFTCTDADTETSPNVDQREWTSEKDGVTRIVHVKLDRPASRIHVVENFANPDECDAMEKAALGSGRLERAVTQDGEGGVRVSEHRKAMQVDIEPDWSKEGEGDRIARLSRRIYDYTNHVLGTNISEQGQEPLMSIQYFGRGYHDSDPDRYMPHCDGKCVGKPHNYGGRMATMVIYCTIPKKGGHTNFQNADVHVRPQVGSGIFFSYIDPATNLTDFGLTQHSGCPVYEGEKKIITQWVRKDVNSEMTYEALNSRKCCSGSKLKSDAPLWMSQLNRLLFLVKSLVDVLISEGGE
jgi:hypothetical protein